MVRIVEGYTQTKMRKDLILHQDIHYDHCCVRGQLFKRVRVRVHSELPRTIRVRVRRLLK